MNAALQFFDYAKWWIFSKIGRKDPLVNTMIIHFACNLRCKHCSVMASGDPPALKMSYDEIVSEMESKYKEGAKIMYFEGGETTMWKDGDKNLGDLIKKSKEIGYFNTGYTTNGTNKIYTNSDVISVSIDGPREVHDGIRGEGVFDKLMRSLEELEFDGSVFANMVIQKDNLAHIEETVKLIHENPKIKGGMFNFITPPPHEISLTPEEKKEAVDLLLELKERGYPILNSKKGLKLLAQEDWTNKCPYFMTSFTVAGGFHFNGCPMQGTDACKKCGFAAPREYYLVTKGDPLTIMELSALFAMSK